MQVPLEIVYRNVTKNDALDRLITEQAAKLDRHCQSLQSCRIAIERPNEYVSGGSGYRVRIDVRPAGSHELVVVREPSEGGPQDALEAIVRNAFAAAARRLQRLDDKRGGHVKQHGSPATSGVVSKLFDDYGFLLSREGREIYFHRNAVLGGRFDALREGSSVSFAEEMGDDGPQASTVHIQEQGG